MKNLKLIIVIIITLSMEELYNMCYPILVDKEGNMINYLLLFVNLVSMLCMLYIISYIISKLILIKKNYTGMEAIKFKNIYIIKFLKIIKIILIIIYFTASIPLLIYSYHIFYGTRLYILLIEAYFLGFLSFLIYYNFLVRKNNTFNSK